MTQTTTETGATKFSLEGILKKVQGLLAMADDPNIDPSEAALFADKAEQLMIKYRIDAEEARERGEVPGMKPEWSEILLATARGEWMNYYYTFAYHLARHCGVRIRSKYGDGKYSADVLGFAHDVAFFNLMYTNVVHGFASKLEPKFDPAESLAANALRLRQGGMERARIAKLIFANTKPMTTVNEQKAANRAATKLIKDEADRLGDPRLAEEVLGRGFNAKTYRRSYAQGFLDHLTSRLWTLASNHTDNGLVLKRAKEEVDAMWYDRYPHEKPSTDPKDADYKPCENCKKAKSGSCRLHTYRQPKAQPMNWSAVDKGRDAARSVDLGAVQNRQVR